MKIAIIVACAIALTGCAAVIPTAVATAPIWVPVVETAIGAGVTLGGEILAPHHQGNAPDPVSRP